MGTKRERKRDRERERNINKQRPIKHEVLPVCVHSCVRRLITYVGVIIA